MGQTNRNSNNAFTLEQVYLFFKVAKKSHLFTAYFFTMRLGVKEPLGMAQIPSLDSQHQKLIKQAQLSLLLRVTCQFFKVIFPLGRKRSSNGRAKTFQIIAGTSQ